MKFERDLLDDILDGKEVGKVLKPNFNQITRSITEISKKAKYNQNKQPKKQSFNERMQNLGKTDAEEKPTIKHLMKKKSKTQSKTKCNVKTTKLSKSVQKQSHKQTINDSIEENKKRDLRAGFEQLKHNRKG